MWNSNIMFSIPFWKTHTNNFKEKKKEILKVLKKYPEEPVEYHTFKTNRQGKNTYLLSDEFLKIFHEEINLLAGTLKKNFQMKKVWSVSYKTNEYHPYHHHGDKGLSGILYLNLKKDMPHTVFVSPMPDWREGRNTYFNLPVKEGDMMVVPSYLAHFTPPNLSKEEKRVIAFDIDEIEI